MSFILKHTTIAVDLWVILALILLIALIVFFLIRNHQMKKQEKELEDEIKEIQGQGDAGSSGNFDY